MVINDVTAMALLRRGGPAENWQTMRAEFLLDALSNATTARTGACHHGIGDGAFQNDAPSPGVGPLAGRWAPGGAPST
jgi:hypothetical protein